MPRTIVDGMTRLWLKPFGATLLVLCVAEVCVASTGQTAMAASFALSRELMSPFCPGMTLATCPSEAAADLRSEISERFSAGDDAEQITQTLERRFGISLRGTPEPRGWGLAVWAVPGFLGLGMLGILIAAVGPRSSRSLTGFDNQVPDIDLELLSRLDEELDRLG